jgi:uncharacterized protein
MLSIQRFLSKSDRFFDLFEASAQEACQSVRALTELFNTPEEKRSLQEFILRRRQTKRINEELTTLLCSTFVTPLEREDIEALARVLYRIPKTAEKFSERMLLAQSFLPVGFFAKQVEMLQQATETVLAMVHQLRRKPRLDKIKEDNDRLHQIEGEADKLLLSMLADLYGGKREPLQVIVLRDLFELLEKLIDRCRDAGNVIFQIVLKNS